MDRKLFLIILDGQPWRNARKLNGNLEGWVASGDARVWRMRSVLPSTSATCYASIHTGVGAPTHKVYSNDTLFRVEQPDIFSEVAAAGGRCGAVAHSFWSTFFQEAPFDAVRHIEYDNPDGPIHHGRFHTMTGANNRVLMTPCDQDLFATLSMLDARHDLTYGMLHACTLDSLGHKYGHDCVEMDHACYQVDAALAPYIDLWRANGAEVIVTADHGQTDRGHHGGTDDEMRDVALYYFGAGEGPSSDTVLDQLQLAPTVLARLGISPPSTMTAKPFLA